MNKKAICCKIRVDNRVELHADDIWRITCLNDEIGFLKKTGYVLTEKLTTQQLINLQELKIFGADGEYLIKDEPTLVEKKYDNVNSEKEGLFIHAAAQTLTWSKYESFKQLLKKTIRFRI